MKLPPLDLTKRQKRYLWLAGFIIVAIPVSYMINFLCRPISGDSGDWGTFGDFVGGLLNPLISLLTLIVTVIIALYLAKNENEKTAASISASYQPQIVAEQTVFYTYLSDKFQYRKTSGFSKTKNAGLVSNQSPNLFGIDIYNIGLGPAKNVALKYEIDTNVIIASLTAMANVFPEPHDRVSIARTPFPPHPDLLFFTYPPHWHSKMLQIPDVIEEEYITHLLNVEISNQPFLYLLPRHVLELYTIFQYYWMEQMQQDANQLPTFPMFYLHAKYVDIGNKTINRKFQINLNSLQGGLSEFTNKITVKEFVQN